VIALPADATRNLLEPHLKNKKIITNLGRLKHQAITTIYLQYPEAIDFQTDIMAINQKHIQWLVNHQHLGQNGLLAAVVVRDPEISSQDDDKLSHLCLQDLKSLFPDWPRPSSMLVVREPAAVLSCTRTVEQNRPDSDFGLENTFLAGDYIQTELPASLESAAKSGIMCTELILDRIKPDE
jgi:hypothetical protein